MTPMHSVMAKRSSYDIIIVGGGTAGCVVASRLRERRPSLQVLLVEAGKDITHHPHVYKPLEARHLHGSDIDYKYMTVPQKHLQGKPVYNCRVRALSGGVAINAGGWIRGDAQDYDEWARVVDDERWSYEGLLPYFTRSEHNFTPDADQSQHGSDSPMYTSTATTSGNHFPLREIALRLWTQLGLQQIPDANSGCPQGVAELVDNRRNGLQQLTSVVDPLGGVKFITETLVSRILLGKKVAVGIETVDGEVFRVRDGGEVVLSSGSYRTPQILMLSGIGDAGELKKHGIEQHVDLPSVGKNLHDHTWKLRDPHQALAMGHHEFWKPSYEKGGLGEWIATMTVPEKGLREAISKDERKPASQDHPLVKGPRSHLEATIMYAAMGGEKSGIDIPDKRLYSHLSTLRLMVEYAVDGTHIMNYCMGALPTSRGAISLSSADPKANPLIDPNYYATEVDKYVMRSGWRMLSRLMLETAQGKKLIAGKAVSPGHESLSSTASDELIDERIKMGGESVYHPAGTAAMGPKGVVDGSLKVHGVEQLRVVDASVVPMPLASHYQVAVFGIAEQAADILLNENKTI